MWLCDHFYILRGIYRNHHSDVVHLKQFTTNLIHPDGRNLNLQVGVMDQRLIRDYPVMRYHLRPVILSPSDTRWHHQTDWNMSSTNQW